MHTNFFESIDSESTSTTIWNKYEPSMKGEVIFEGIMRKHSKGSREALTSRYFILQKDYLLYKKDQSSDSIASAMSIAHAKLELPGQDDSDPIPESMAKIPFAIKICFKNKYSILYASNESQFKQWVSAMTRVMLRSDFHTRFNVAKIIGSGAFANVYEALDKTSGLQFAVKGFNKEFLEQDPKGKIALWNEISVLKGIDHPNLLKLHEVHETKNSIYLVFDLYEGGELGKFVDSTKGLLKEDQILKIFVGLLRGLNYMAERSLAHRDLKPNNIMMKRTTHIDTSDVVIVDFGLAASLNDKNLIYKRCGTPGYIAPEVIAAKNADSSYRIPEKSDIYSIGVILYVLCAGKSPFEKPDWDADMIMKKNLEAKVEFPSVFFGRFSSELIQLLKGLLAADPKKRLTAKEALSSNICGGHMKEAELVKTTDYEFERGAGSLYGSVNSFASFRRVPHEEKGDAHLSNNSIAVNSTGYIENKECDGKGKKGPYQNLYKQSLMKGVSSRKGSRASSIDRSVENSPGLSFLGSSQDSSNDSSNSAGSPKKGISKALPLSPARRSHFVPK